MKNFTSVKDVDNVEQLVKEAIELKRNPFAHQHLGKYKTIGLFFFNPSLRTRLSMQKAATNIGLNVIVMNVGSQGWKIEFEDGQIMDGNAAEHIKEGAAVMSQYCDIIAVRSFPELKNRELDYEEKVLSQFVKNATVPIISLESATLHPLQSLADLMTIREHQITSYPKVVLTWAPHPRALPQAVANSFVEWMKAAEVNFIVTHPEGYELAPQFSAGVKIEYDQSKAFEDADFVYAKNWSSYNQYGKVLSIDKKWMVDSSKMVITNQAKFMHCLPVRRNVVVSDAVIDGPDSFVIKQAENRIYSAQIVLKKLLEYDQ